MKNNSAFPVFDSRNAGQDYECADPGMTLRDYFAAKAMQALLANLGPYEDDPHRLDRKEYYKRSDLAYDADTLAEYAYTQADAMMKARGEQ